MENVLKVEGLVKRYGDFALDGVSLRVPAGCVTGFIGGNGAGKTTTIKSVLGIVMPDGGSVELFGERLTLVATPSSHARRHASAWCSTPARSPRRSASPTWRKIGSGRMRHGTG